MHLLNAAVALAAAIAGTVGATAAYGTLNTAPVGHAEPMVEPVTLTHYLRLRSTVQTQGRRLRHHGDQEGREDG